jgi:hypothetical protein
MHAGLLLRHVVLVAAICLPIAMAGEDGLQEYLRLMRAVFGFSALVVTAMATFSQARLSPTSLCIWDHATALLLLKLACALAVGIVA